MGPKVTFDISDLVFELESYPWNMFQNLDDLVPNQPYGIVKANILAKSNFQPFSS